MKLPRLSSWPWLVVLVGGFLLLLWMPTELYARAGGGGGGGGGSGRGGIFKLIFLLCYLVYASIVWMLIRRRERQAGAVLEKLVALENSWGRNAIRERVRETYFKVQAAWAARDNVPAREYMSERLFNLHQWKCAEMKASHRRNILDNIVLEKIQIVEVADFLDDSQDRMWVVIHGSMVDYIMDERTGEVVRGDRHKTESFKELWKFVRGSRGWVLDEIDQSVGLDDLFNFKSSAESLNPP